MAISRPGKTRFSSAPSGERGFVLLDAVAAIFVISIGLFSCLRSVSELLHAFGRFHTSVVSWNEHENERANVRFEP